MAELTQWEYATIPLIIHNTKGILDQWGEDGYELVTVLPGPEGKAPVAYLKRPILPTPPVAYSPEPPTTESNSEPPTTIEDRLTALGLSIPTLAPPAAAYQSAVVTDGVVYISGQLPLVDGKLPVSGKVGAEVSAEQAYDLARTCGLNLIAALKHAVGDLDRITRIAKVGGFVASAPDFTGQPQVINGTSELLAEVFGDVGQHARSAVGVAVLPMDTPVEVDLIAHIS